jgi:hypothetical protein
MRRRLAVLAAIAIAVTAAIVSAVAAGPAAFARVTARDEAASAGSSAAPVVGWNRTLLQIVRTPGAQPAALHPTRSFAIVHAAIYDAVDSITRSDRPYLFSVEAPEGASAEAAAAQAGHDALLALYPGMRSLIDGELATLLAAVPEGPARRAGVRVGTLSARFLIAARDGDVAGVGLGPPFVPGANPGDYRPTPPNFPKPVFTDWATVPPFGLNAARQFRPAPPPALTSAAYARAINEVESLGRDTSTTRTPDETTAARFWAAPIWNYWNEIAQTEVLAHHTGLVQAARLFAVLDISFADGVIAFYDAKYFFHLWRPITAIRLADTDGNPATVADPAWNPLATTPADPSYPGAHSVISQAGAVVLGAFFGDRQDFTVTSEVLPGVTRSFDRFQDAADEAGLSRIFAGLHTRLDHDSGQLLGRDVARFELRTVATNR